MTTQNAAPRAVAPTAEAIALAPDARILQILQMTRDMSPRNAGQAK